MKKVLFLILITITLVCCEKSDNSTTKSPIADKEWKLIGLNSSEPISPCSIGIWFVDWDYSKVPDHCFYDPSITAPTEFHEFIADCLYDDRFIFNNSSLFQINRNTLCSDQDNSIFKYSSWKIENNKLVLSDDGTINSDWPEGEYWEKVFDIVDLTENYLTISIEAWDIIFTYSFEAQ